MPPACRAQPLTLQNTTFVDPPATKPGAGAQVVISAPGGVTVLDGGDGCDCALNSSMTAGGGSCAISALPYAHQLQYTGRSCVTAQRGIRIHARRPSKPYYDHPDGAAD